MWEHDILAIARLRGPQLHKLELVEDCILPFGDEGEFEEDYTVSYSQFIDEVCSSQNK